MLVRASYMKGERAYNLRRQYRNSWSEIAVQIGYKDYHSALRGARNYADRKGLPWPLKKLTKGGAIYASRKNGMSWMSIAKHYDGNISRTQRCAYKWAKRNSKAWPPK